MNKLKSYINIKVKVYQALIIVFLFETTLISLSDVWSCIKEKVFIRSDWSIYTLVAIFFYLLTSFFAFIFFQINQKDNKQE